jgi:2-oxoglutarate ferredoxin oxidoreductase subunit beta
MTTATPETEKPKFKLTDYASDQDVRWCPGCGDYSILAAVKRVLAKFNNPPDQYCFISGIGCSSRFPYYMGTYGIHSIHGRAPAVATGFKAVKPNMQTWVITGDGDGFSIGGNHMLHALRRNVDLKILLFNNRIYGLTKGQYSPTSEPGKVTKSTPMGSIDNPLEPIAVALAAEASFVARTIDLNIKHMCEVLERAHEHKGTAFVEILQNCNIFNDGAWKFATDKEVKHDNVVELKQGEPLLYGKEKNKGIRINRKTLNPEQVIVGEDGITEDDLLVHDEKATEGITYALARMSYPENPIPIGVFRDHQRPIYEQQLVDQVAAAREKKGEPDLQKLLTGRATWTVEDKAGAAGNGSAAS